MSNSAHRKNLDGNLAALDKHLQEREREEREDEMTDEEIEEELREQDAYEALAEDAWDARNED